MSLFWVASVAAVMGQTQAPTLPKSPMETISASVAVVTDAPSGWPTVSIQISEDGLFLMAAPTVVRGSALAKLKDASTVTLDLVAHDEISQLALYRARNFKVGSGRAMTVASVSQVEGKPLLVITSKDIVAGEFVAADRVGVLMPSQRYAPLSEIRFEQPTGGTVGGGLVFSWDGSLVGVLNATLVPFRNEPSMPVITKIRPGQKAEHFGPRPLVVGYALAPSVLKRVVSGFLTPGHTPRHPSIGVLYRTNKGGGVEIQSVEEGSPAAIAKLLAGDIVQSVDGIKISDNIHMATVLFDSEVDQKRVFGVLRDNRKLTLTVKVGELQTGAARRMASPSPRTTEQSLLW